MSVIDDLMKEIYKNLKEIRSGYFFIEGVVYEVRVKFYKEPNEYGKLIDIESISPDGFDPFSRVDRSSHYKYIEENIEALCNNAGIVILASRAIEKKYKRYVYDNKDGLKSWTSGEEEEPFILWNQDVGYKERYIEIANEVIKENYYPFRRFLLKVMKKKPGISFDAALEYLKEHPLDFTIKAEYDNTDPIISISKPDITRESSNKDKNTFDFVSVEILLRSDLKIKNLESFIKKNMKAFDKRAREAIASNKSYQKYNVPVEYLTLYGIATRGVSCLEFKYELKKID